jgi:uncharacterized protein (UPF0264 family)
MTQLLVSVRSAAEAEIALAGGAALVDVKEPHNGPLGMAAASVIGAVLDIVAGRVPVSAALGEARDAEGFLPDTVAAQLAFVKYGAAGCRGDLWQRAFSNTQRRLEALNSSCRVVVAAYGDWQRAGAPSPDELCRFACEQRAGAFLLDTWGKDGSTLLDWMPMPEIETLCRRCRAARVPIALAGSLGPHQIGQLTALDPDWIAVRGAVCRGRRQDNIDLVKVRALAELIDDLTLASRAG